jgi:hypothetical protein
LEDEMMKLSVALGIAVIAGMSICSCSDRAGADGPTATVAESLIGGGSYVNLEGYADRTSVLPGDTINFFINTPADTTYYMQFLRYGTTRSGVPQGLPTVMLDSNNATYQTINCGAACVNRTYPDTAARDGAGWDQLPPGNDAGEAGAIPFPIPTGWSSGIYAAKLCTTAAECAASPDPANDPVSGNTSPYIMFVVKAASPAPIILLASTNTWTAYDFWPYDPDAAFGSWYSTPSCGLKECLTDSDCASGGGTCLNNWCSSRPTTLSFLRPNPNAAPYYQDLNCGTSSSLYYLRSGHLALGNIEIAEWLESQRGANTYSVFADSDLDASSTWLSATTSPSLIVPTHSEYWTSNMVANLTAYVAAGGNVVSLSGNTMEWQASLSTGQISSRTTHLTQPTPSLTGQAYQEGAPEYHAGGTDHVICSSYVRSSSIPAQHWAFSGADTSQLGTAGFSFATTPSYCGNSLPGGVLGAVGWESDSFESTLQGQSTAFGFKHSFRRLATTNYLGLTPSCLGGCAGPNGPADVVLFQNVGAGAGFSVGSILFGQSLLVDSSQTTQGFTPVLKNVLDRFSHPTFGDFDHDGYADILARNHTAGTLSRYAWNASTSSFHSPSTLPVQRSGVTWNSYNSLISIGDFDTDGTSDMLAIDASGKMFLYCGNGDGTFCTSSTCPPAAAHARTKCTTAAPVPQIDSGWTGFTGFAGVGDFDSDGLVDLLAATSATTMKLYRGKGDGTFIPGGVPVLIDSSQTADYNGVLIPIGDFDADGNVDLLVEIAATSGSYSAGCIAFFPGDGSGAFKNVSQCINSGWGSLKGFMPMGNLAGNAPPVPNMLVVNSSGALLEYKGNNLGNFANGNTTISGTSGVFGAYDILMGVW